MCVYERPADQSSAGRLWFSRIRALSSLLLYIPIMPTLRSSSLRTAAVAALLFSASCYKYTPVSGGAVATGREVELQLSEQGSIALAPQLGAQLKSVSGRVSDYSADAYQVSVTQTTSRGGVETLWGGETATVRHAYVTSVGERQLDKTRSWIVAGITAFGVAVVGQAFGVDAGLGGLFRGSGGGTRQ